MGIVLLVLVVLGASVDSFSHFKAAKSQQSKPEVIVQDENSATHEPQSEQSFSEITNEQDKI